VRNYFEIEIPKDATLKKECLSVLRMILIISKLCYLSW